MRVKGPFNDDIFGDNNQRMMIIDKREQQGSKPIFVEKIPKFEEDDLRYY